MGERSRRKEEEGGGRTAAKRVLYLVALVSPTIIVPTATAQDATERRETSVSGDLPKSGGASVGSLLLPADELLVGSGVPAYAMLGRR